MRDQVTNKKFGRLKRNLARAIDRPEDYSTIVELVQFSWVIIQAFFHSFRSSAYYMCINQGITSTDSVSKNFRAVLVNKVPEAFDKAGITPSELNEIGYRIERISPSITIVLVEGLEMFLDRYEAENEFNALNNSQKIYAILSASENLTKKQGKQKWEVLSTILGLDQSIEKKFARIESGRLVDK